MKKLTLILLAVVMCFSACACQSEDVKTLEGTFTINDLVITENSNNDSSSVSSDPQTEALTIENIVGLWKSANWFFNSTIQINANTTYIYGLEKGTVAIYGERFQLNDTSGMYKTGFACFNGYIYETGHSFEKDTEYGLAFSPDANGRTDQTFNYAIINVSTIDTSYSANCIFLDLDSDGTYTITTGTRSYSSFKKKEEFKGTYTYSDSILKLTYNNQAYPFIVDDGIIYFHVFEK